MLQDKSSQSSGALAPELLGIPCLSAGQASEHSASCWGWGGGNGAEQLFTRSGIRGKGSCQLPLEVNVQHCPSVSSCSGTQGRRHRGAGRGAAHRVWLNISPIKICSSSLLTGATAAKRFAAGAEYSWLWQQEGPPEPTEASTCD